MNTANVELTLNTVHEYLKKGQVFLTTKHEKVNTMIVGWGGIQNFWGKPIFVVPVRKSRYTYESISTTKEFTVSIPVDVELSNAVKFCGSKSGRDYDKFKECNFTAVDSKTLNVPIIKECTLHFECRVVFTQEMDMALLNSDLVDRWYSEGNEHTLFYGEILACYETHE